MSEDPSPAAMTLDAYIKREAGKMSPTRLRQLGSFGDSLRAKLDGSRAEEGVRNLVAALLRVLDSEETRSASDPLPRHLREAGVAASYLLKGADLIPDEVEGIGLADDAIIIAKVFARNPILHAMADVPPR